MSKTERSLIYFLIFVSIILSAWYVINKDIYFHTDIARDFLLIEDIIETHRPTLIGPRSGGIPGVFHGPLWLYLNLPAFLLANGNPVGIGYFWLFLLMVNLIVVFIIAKKIFNERTAVLSVLLFSTAIITATPGLFNPFGAVILSPLFLYFFWRYLVTLEVKSLIISLFILGLIVQFQIAFGLPLIFLIIAYMIPFLHKRKKLANLIFFTVLLIPLSSFILFDFRHNFLQTRSIINYFLGGEMTGKPQFWQYFWMRIKGFFIDTPGLLTGGLKWTALLIAMLVFFILYKVCKNPRSKNRDLYFLFFYFYLGYWLIAFLFRGIIWSYYYWPFLPLLVMVFSSSERLLNKRVFASFFTLILMINFYYGIRHAWRARNFIGVDLGSWQFNYQAAKWVFNDADGEFGYYIFTPDLFGYSPRYALNFVQKTYKDKQGYPFEKKEETYLLLAPSDTPYANADWWRKNQVKISKQPDKVLNFQNGFKIEKYRLTPEETSIQSDPNLIQSLHFR